jgi:protein SCO1
MKRAFILGLAAAMLVVTAGAATVGIGLKAGVFEPPRTAPEIALPATDGSAFALNRYRGKVVVLEFGYTSCTEVCPVSLASLAQARKLLGPAASGMQVVFVTVDPQRDSAARLRSYLASFDSGFVGITGTPAQMAAVQKAYGISVTRKMVEGSKTDYTVHHSSYLYFIDRKGMLRALMPFGQPAADIAHDIALLLKN